MDTTEQELKEAFISFFDFSLSLIEKLDKHNGYLKFAVVNMQISLELFLKYFFLKKLKPETVFLQNGKFRDFSNILNSYFSYEREPFISKKKLNSILESRNSIVHKGKMHEWDNELAESLINCVFFIQRTYQLNFEKTLINSEILSHKISENLIWRKNVEKFASEISNGGLVLKCPACKTYSMVNMELFNFDEYNQIEGIQCLCCFINFETEVSTSIIQCNRCSQVAYLLDKLNDQGNQMYLGLCLMCANSNMVRMCAGCENYYFPSENKEETFFEDRYYCSPECLELNLC